MTQLPQNVKRQPQVLPEEVDKLSCRLLDARSIVNPTRTPWYIPVNFVCYRIPWEGQYFTTIIVLLVLEETNATSVVGDF